MIDINNVGQPIPVGYFQDENMNAMFSAFPPIVQETILQSGAKPRNEQQLQNLYEAFRS